MLDEEKVVIVDKLSYRNRDCSNHLTEDKRPSMEEDKTYYKFFNEWRDIKEVLYENKMYKVNKDSYDGIVWFTPIKEDIKRLTLSDLKPRTKTVYEEVTESICDLKSDFEDGKLYYLPNKPDNYEIIDTMHILCQCASWSTPKIFRKVEKEIDWRDEVSDHFVEHEIADGSGEYRIDSDDFLDVCRKVLRATGELE